MKVRVKNVLTILVATFLVHTACGQRAANKNVQPIELTKHSQLFVDDFLIEHLEGVTRVLNNPEKLTSVPGVTYGQWLYASNVSTGGTHLQFEPVLKADHPWEDGQVVLQPGTVIYDQEEKLFKMWYEAPTTHPDRMPASVLCYATSTDGIRWQKPQLNLIAFHGSKANNIVLGSEQLRNNWFAHSVIKDAAESDPERRYKMVYWDEPTNRGLGICLAFSVDGIHWKKYPGNPVVPDWASGDNFCLMQDPVSKHYILCHRSAIRPTRRIARLVSDDFVHWRDDRLVLEPDIYDQPDTEFYGVSASPYAGNYVGFLWVFHLYPQLMDIQMVFSRDAVHWTRVANRKAFIQLGYMVNMYGGYNFDRSMVFPASAPVRVGNELWFYYSGFDKTHNIFEENHGAIGLAKLRVDGFCSLDATSGGYVLTKPVKFHGSAMSLNADLRTVHSAVGEEHPPVWSDLFPENPEGSGWIRVEVQDERGHALPGYEASNCDVLRGDSINHAVSWKDNKSLEALQGHVVRFKLMISNGKIYSFKIQ
jgi:hypothetical protein